MADPEQEVVDAEVVPDRTGGPDPRAELVPAPSAPATLFRTDDPKIVLERATELADTLKPLIAKQGWSTKIGDREHVHIEGWQSLGGMVGVFSTDPQVTEIPWPPDERLTKQLRLIRGKGYAFGFKALAQARTMSGQIVGGGEGECRRTEKDWATRKGKVVDDYALRSMAQTRASSRTLASPLRFIVELAGYAGTPAEEATQGQSGGGRPTAKPPAKAKAAPKAQAGERESSQPPITPEQKGEINQRMGAAGYSAAEAKAIRVWWTSTQDCQHFDRLPRKAATGLIRKLGKDGKGGAKILESLRAAARSEKNPRHVAAQKIVEQLEAG